MKTNDQLFKEFCQKEGNEYYSFFKNDILEFAELYHQEQVKNLDLSGVSKPFIVVKNKHNGSAFWTKKAENEDTSEYVILHEAATAKEAEKWYLNHFFKT